MLHPNAVGIAPITPKELGKSIIDHVETLFERSIRESELALMLGTAAAESDFQYLFQMNGGPARGYFQMEPSTAASLHDHYIRYKQERISKVLGAVINIPGDPVLIPGINDWMKDNREDLLSYNIGYMIVMTRLNYYKDPEALPKFNDVAGLAEYWKRIHNTHLGAGKIEDFKLKYHRYGIYNLIMREL